jgi:hypothetical protein
MGDQDTQQQVKPTYRKYDIWCVFWGFLNLWMYGATGSILALSVGVLIAIVGIIGVQRTYNQRNPIERNE